MGITAAQLVAKVGVEGADKAKSDLQGMGQSVKETSGGFKSMLGNALSFAAGQAIFNLVGKAVGFLKDQMVDTVKIAMAHQDVMAQTAQAIKSTGDASGLSATQIGDMATALSKTTKFSEDTVQGGENLLLTFTGIGKDVFPMATNAMVDLSQAMGQDMKSSAIQLGKALNDPRAGMSALQRVGVTFSDSEKQQIKTMMSHNDVIGAQKVMLAELNKEFGGSAQAAGKTFSGALAILKNNFDDLKEKVGSAVIPILSNLVQLINTNVLPLFDKLGPVVKNVVSYFKSFELGTITYQWHQLTNAVNELLKPLGGAGGAMKQLTPFLTEMRNGFSQLLVSGIKDVAGFIGNVAIGIHNLTSGGQTSGFFTGLSQTFREFAPLIQRVAGLMGGELMRELKDLGQLAQQVGQWFNSSVVPAMKQAAPGFESLGKTILTTVIPAFIQIRGVVMDVVEHAFKTFGPILEKIIPPLITLSGQIAGGLSQALKFLMPYITQAVQAIGKFADEIMVRVAPIVKNWISGLSNDIKIFQAIWTVIWPGISQVLQGVWNEIVGIVKIAWSIVSGIIKIGLDLISGNWSGAWNDVKDMFKGIWDGIVTLFKGVWQSIQGVVKTIVDGVVALFTGLWDKLTGHSIIPDMINDIVRFFSQLPGRVMAFVQSLFSSAVNIFHALWNAAVAIVSGMINGLIGWFQQLPGRVGSILGGLPGLVMGALSNAASAAFNGGMNIVNGIANGIRGAIGAVGDAIGTVTQFISDHLPHSPAKIGPLRDLATSGTQIAHQIAEGMKAGAPTIQSAMAGLVKPISLSVTPGSGSFAGGNGSSFQFPSVANASPTIIINMPPSNVYMDGRLVANGLMPHITNAIRTNTGVRI